MGNKIAEAVPHIEKQKPVAEIITALEKREEIF